jgi:hypothetical protein
MPFEFRHCAEAARALFSVNSLFIVPLAPKKSVEVEVAKSAHGGSHLALKRLPAHFAVSDNFKADFLLQRDGVVDGAIFDFFELSRTDLAGGELLLRRKQFRRPKQASDHIRVNGDHAKTRCSVSFV